MIDLFELIVCLFGGVMFLFVAVVFFEGLEFFVLFLVFGVVLLSNVFVSLYRLKFKKECEQKQ